MHWIAIADGLHAARECAGSLLAAFAQAAAPLTVAALWQGAAIAVVLALCLRLAPRVSAAHRFAVWAAGFAVLACLPFLSLLAHSAATGIGPASPLQAAPAKPWLQFDSRWALALSALWLLASTFRAVQLIAHSIRLRRLWKTATPIAVDGSLRLLLAAASPMRPIEICTTPELDRPGVIGFFAPRILVPDWLFARLTPGELEQVVLHEAEHLRRRDDWINLLQKLALVLFPLNLALTWIEGRLCREREMACDEGVVHRTQAPRAYAACLTNLAERGRQRDDERRAEALSLSAWQRRPELARRVHSVLDRQQFLHPPAARALVAVVGCGLFIASVELAHCPQMVAFVPAAKPAAQNVALAQAEPARMAASYGPVDSMILTRSSAHFRAIETKAILSVNHRAAPSLAPDSSRPAAAPAAGTEEREVAAIETQAGTPPQVFLKAEMPPRAVTPARTSEQYPNRQFVVVFTSWEEVRTARQNTGEITDYDTGATGHAGREQTSQDAQAQPRNQPATQFIVTRLILRIEPASAANPAGAQKTLHGNPSEPSQQPTAIPIAGGWLILKL